MLFHKDTFHGVSHGSKCLAKQHKNKQKLQSVSRAKTLLWTCYLFISCLTLPPGSFPVQSKCWQPEHLIIYQMISDNHQWSRLRCYYGSFLRQMDSGLNFRFKLEEAVIHTVACNSVMCSQDLLELLTNLTEKDSNVHTLPALSLSLVHTPSFRPRTVSILV